MLIGYARTSTVEQVAGLEAQHAALAATGCNKLFSEQASSVAQRSQLDAALDFVREGDTLIVTRLDRLARSTADLGRLECSALRMNSAVWSSLPGSACTLGATGSAGPDRIGKTTYDAAGEAIKVQSAYGTADQADEGTATYNANGTLATLTDAQVNKTTYEYDGFDRLVKTRYPSTTAGSGTSSTTDYEQLGYDANSNVTSRRLRDGQSIGYAYDALDRLVVKDVPGDTVGDVYYGYDLLGALGSARFGSTSGAGVSFAYDALGRATSTTSTMGGVSRTLSYQYDVAGTRTRITHPDGAYFTYASDVLGRVTGASWNAAATGTVGFFGIGYDDLGRRTGTYKANGSTTYGYDAPGRLATLGQSLLTGSLNATTTFGYNPASQIVASTRSMSTAL